MRKFLFIVVLILLAVTSAQLWMTKDRTSQQNEISQPAVESKPDIGGAFTLTDTKGNIAHDIDFRGRIMLVYFGFTQCPEACPLTLSMMSKTMAALGDKANQVVPIFITVDPAHDTPAVLKDYLTNFDKRMVGLTGTDEHIKQVEDAYKVYAAKQEMNEKGQTTFDHSSYIYVMGKDGKFLTAIASTSQAQDIVNVISPYLSQP